MRLEASAEAVRSAHDLRVRSRPDRGSSRPSHAHAVKIGRRCGRSTQTVEHASARNTEVCNALESEPQLPFTPTHSTQRLEEQRSRSTSIIASSWRRKADA